MIVDTHIHYLEPASVDRPHDPEGNVMDLHSVEEMLAASSAIGIDAIVQAAPSTMGFDNRYSLEGARRHPGKVLGVFGRFDPFAPEIEARLEAVMEPPEMLGTRIQMPPGNFWDSKLEERGLDPFLRAAERRGITVTTSAAGRATELSDIAKRFRALRIVVEHMTLSRGMSAENWSAYWPRLTALAAEPNVWLKVSLFPESAPKGERYPFPTAQHRFKQFYEHAGPQRLMWGSNFPPVSRSCTYREAFDFMRTCTQTLPSADLEAVMGRNFLKTFARDTRVPGSP